MAINDAGMFTVKEINRLKILQDVIDRNIRPGQAAEMLGITPRHCSRLLKRYRQYGPLGMNNQSRGRPGNHRLPESLKLRVLSLLHDHYSDFGPTLAVEKVQLWQCDEVQAFENMDIEFAINNPHYLSGFTITADLFQNTKGK
ncbi:helix-turn-helix domain-containing protein [Escherichia coli]|uniref:helix-turn-helix domain-containing protein n=1 Tax=Escherichia coli TaxID=562 RepID=UPI001FCE8817|nr:helix-turn-helix domain-containing protein [Escherichia coli]